MVCMNFLAMPTLKNVRSCFFLPISIMPLRSLNDTFESARIGIANAGSFECWAAATTTSAMPTSLVSTPPATFRFLALGAGSALVLAPAVFFVALALAMLSSALPSDRLLRARLAWLACLLRLLGRRFRFADRLDLTLDPFCRHDDRVRQALGAAAGLAELLLELLDRELAALQAIAGFCDLLDVQLEDVAPPELTLRAPATPQEHAKP